MRSIKFIGALALAVFIAGFAATVFAACPATPCLCTETCNTATGVCGAGNAPSGTACGNFCTNDLCDGSGTCVAGTAVANGTLCNADNNMCTGSVNNTLVNDSCQSGVCVAGPLKTCTGTNTCKNYGACNTATGNCPAATNLAVGTACDDGKPCTLNDVCAAGGVCKGTPNFCRDSDPCTEDACTTSTGACTHTPVGTSGVCGLACSNPIPADVKLLITPGQGATTNVPCSVGSCFSMVNGTDIIWTDILPGTDGGFWVGHPQASGGQELTGGGSVSTSGALTAAWSFFNAEGTFFTSPDGGTLNKFCGTSCQTYDCLNKTELKVFTVAWNGGPILMGSAAGCVLSNCSILNNNDVMVNSWQFTPVNGGAWSMDYAQVVPVGSFSNVNFKAVLRGTVSGLPPNFNICNDNNPCTDDSFDVATSTCVHTATSCDDNDACTTDSCDPATGCVHTAIAGCALSAPTLIQPSDGQTEVLTTVEFRWTKSTNTNNDPVTYKIYYCKDSTFTDPACTPVTVASRSSKGMFYAGGAGLFMIGITFLGGLTGRKKTLLLILILVLFVGGTVISCKAKNDTELSADQSNYVASGLSSNTTYYWKVAAINGTTGRATESSVQSFTTK